MLKKNRHTALHRKDSAFVLYDLNPGCLAHSNWPFEYKFSVPIAINEAINIGHNQISITIADFQCLVAISRYLHVDNPSQD